MALEKFSPRFVLQKAPPLTEEQEIALEARNKAMMAEEAAERKIREDAVREYRQALRGIPPLEQFEGVQPKPFAGGLLWGDVGRGKTREAVARLLSTTRGAFVDARDLFVLFIEWKMDRLEPFEEDRLEAIHSAPQLVIDDLGVRGKTPSPVALEELVSLVNKRVLEGRPLLVTSNLGPREIADTVDPRIMSRIYRFGPIEHMEGHDHRIPKGETIIKLAAPAYGEEYGR